MNPIKILTVDDHPILREGIAAIIENHADIVLVGEAANGREAIECFRKVHPDVTLMDLVMPEMNGIDATVAIRKEFPNARIVVLTTYKGDVQAAHALDAGACGYLLKSSLRKDLLDTIRRVHVGQRRIPPEIAMAMAEHHSSDTLSDRELEVLQQIAAGNANKNIAEHLSIAEDTVKGHVKAILAKLGANDRTHAVTIAIKRGIISLEE
jgi:DNA-binding NarL/FixJ family response regulator